RGDEPERAVALLQEALAGPAQARHPLLGTLALVALGYAALDRGDLEEAEGAVWRALALLSGIDLEPSAALGAKVLHAQVLRRRGQLTEALTELDAALGTATAPALLFPRRQALAHRAGTLLELGRPREALEAAREALAMGSEDAKSTVLALRAYGSALRACGEDDLAVRALREALEVARATGQRSEARQTERVLAAAGPRR
ncbi:MAG: guanylate cyclase, partial [Actinomycetota bacterium]|nr:guanylate cyclase [Actinomycetota bacterium]